MTLNDVLRKNIEDKRNYQIILYSVGTRFDGFSTILIDTSEILATNTPIALLSGAINDKYLSRSVLLQQDVYYTRGHEQTTEENKWRTTFVVVYVS